MSHRPLLALLGVAALLGAGFALAGGCTTGAPTCDPPLTTCTSVVCADLTSDPQNCGACARACSSGQICSVKQGESTASCSCPSGTTPCGAVCCGGDGCPAGQTSIDGVCRTPIYAACFNTGEVVPVDDSLKKADSTILIGAGPQTIAFGQGKALVGDTLDNALYTLDPVAVSSAVELYKPSVLADYLFGLAQAYSSFYQQVPFLKAEAGIRESRVRLCGLVAKVLRHGLSLLGIETPERI